MKATTGLTVEYVISSDNLDFEHILLARVVNVLIRLILWPVEQEESHLCVSNKLKHEITPTISNAYSNVKLVVAFTTRKITSYLRSQMTKRNSSKRSLVSWLPSSEISHPQVMQNCWCWSCRRRVSMAAYCTCSLRTLCLLKFSVATLLCRSYCWLGWKVCNSHTLKQVHRVCIAVCTCGLYPRIHCDTDAAFDRLIVNLHSCNGLCSDCTL